MVGAYNIDKVITLKTNALPGDVSALKHELLPWLLFSIRHGYNNLQDSYKWRSVVRAVQIKVDKKNHPWIFFGGGECRRWESNPQSQREHDFESCASASSATPAFE
jgi:hypothetical protein